MNCDIKSLAKTIVNYSIDVQPNEKVLIIYYSNESLDLIKEITKCICLRDGITNCKMVDKQLESLLLKQNNKKIIDILIDEKKYYIDNYDSIIYIKYTSNEYESNTVSKNIMNYYSISSKDIDNIRVNDRKWVLLNYPSIIDAVSAKTGYDDYKEYCFDVMNYDYSKMYNKLLPLKRLMEKTNMVRMIGPGTNISFSIKNMPAIPCCGKYNIPDGEIYTAPIKNSVNGIITYNTPSPYMGNIYNNISLKFIDGKIVEATCDGDNTKLNEIFNTDDGARYIGEFSFGINPKILYPIGNILFDEKIKGSIHFTPGRAYLDCFNGNSSAIHWDLVWVQREEFGGGEVYFDDVLIRKDGIFILDELKELNNL